MTEPKQDSETPILDLAKPLPKPQVDGITLRDLIVPLLLIALIVFSRNYFLLVLPVGFLVLSFVIIAIHEFGHILAGYSVGLRFQSVKVGPLLIERELGRWKLRTRRHLTNGFTLMTLDRILHVRRRLIIFTAGGPLVSLLTGLIAFSALWLIDDGSFLQPLIGWFGVLSLWIMILNLFPRHLGKRTSDGLKLQTLIRSKEGAKRLIASHAILMLKYHNVDPVFWNRRWIRVCSPGEIMQNTYFADELAYRKTVDSSPTNAAQHLERCLEGSAFLNIQARDELILEATVFTAWYRDDAVKADIWFKRTVAPDHIKPLQHIRAQVALYCAHRRFDEALKECENALSIIKQFPAHRVQEHESAWTTWRDEIEQRKNQDTAVKQAASL